MRRRDFIALAAAAGTAAASGVWPSATQAQSPPPRSKHIGFLAALPENDPADPKYLAAMRKGLASQGWVEGQNLQISYWWETSAAATAAIAAQAAVDLKLDAILVGGGTSAGLALVKLTNTIPIVHALSDPVGLGEVRNAARPEGNVTGLTLNEAPLGGKWIDLLRKIAPDAQQVGWLADTTTTLDTSAAGAQQASRARGLEFVLLPFSSPADLPKVIDDWASQSRRALLVAGSVVLANREIIVDRVASHRMPAVFDHLLFAEAGAVLTYAPDQFAILRSGGEYVGLILNGTKVADLPVQDPSSFSMVVNLKAAKEQGITVPTSILASADQVID